jgi:hypothetical protein
MEKENLREMQAGAQDARDNFLREMQQSGGRNVTGDSVIPNSARVNEILVRGMNGGNVANLMDARIGQQAPAPETEQVPPTAERFMRHPGLQAANDYSQPQEMSQSLQNFWRNFQDGGRHMRQLEGGVCGVANPEAKIHSAAMDQQRGDNDMMHGNFEAARFAYFSSLQKWVDGLGARSNDIFKPDPLLSLVHADATAGERQDQAELHALDGSLLRLVNTASRDQRAQLNNLLYSFALTLDRTKPESAAVLRKHIVSA